VIFGCLERVCVGERPMDGCMHWMDGTGKDGTFEISRMAY
jgi:hypothetical protein